ncbi:carotenoid 9,10(9',10')-cleavage dioxygenase 1-like [Carica papaya]|uniref:carotenoid 9,10(9',10')-cleavage dioxygenase 1-like n=1 Tax=Carica papaya TaxID=3649 RepID=UPI000B8CA85B|nr:carotenoid 9,10(9',10')-cleavage dioxygenase 1-like [Carica papaya]
MLEVEEKSTYNNGGTGGVVEVNPKPSKGLTSKVIDLVEKLIVKLMYDSSKPQHYLSGNFAPVPEETPPIHELPVKGHLPECLNGEFVRVGPNPKFAPVAGYHWFDGDGYVNFGFAVRAYATMLVHFKFIFLPMIVRIYSCTFF